MNLQIDVKLGKLINMQKTNMHWSNAVHQTQFAFIKIEIIGNMISFLEVNICLYRVVRYPSQR